MGVPQRASALGATLTRLRFAPATLTSGLLWDIVSITVLSGRSPSMVQCVCLFMLGLVLAPMMMGIINRAKACFAERWLETFLVPWGLRAARYH